MLGKRATRQWLAMVGNSDKIVNNCTLVGWTNVDGGQHISRQRGRRQHNNQPSLGALEAGGGWRPERRALCQGVRTMMTMRRSDGGDNFHLVCDQPAATVLIVIP